MKNKEIFQTKEEIGDWLRGASPAASCVSADPNRKVYPCVSVRGDTKGCCYSRSPILQIKKEKKGREGAHGVPLIGLPSSTEE